MDNSDYEYTLDGESFAVIEDKFTRNFNDWDLYSSNKSVSLIQNNQLVIKSLADEGTSRYISIFNGSGDFIIETEIDFSNAAESEKAGLIFGFKDWNNFNYFLLSGSNMYIGYVKEGMLFQKAEGMYCSSCKEKTINILKVVQFGDKLVFSVNGEVQFASNAILFEGLNIGFAVSGKNQIAVNYLVFKYNDNNSYSDKTTFNDKNISATGTGILISRNGYVVTNEHVVNGAKRIIVENNSKNYNAELIKADKTNDLAILKIKDTSLKNNKVNIPITIKENFNVEVGSYLWTIGYPLVLSGMGKEPKFSDGKLSAKTGYEDALNSFQTTIPVQPGNSGSPVFNDQGELIGIMNAKYKGADNVSYALKSTFIKNLLDILPEPAELNTQNLLKNLKQEDQIKLVKDFVYIIKIEK